MKHFTKLFLPALLLCVTLVLGLAACGEKSFSVTTEFDAQQGEVVLSEEGKGSDGKYAEGSSVTVTVTPKAGYAVKSFTLNGTAQTLSADGKYTFSVKEDAKIAATFETAGYLVTLAKNFGEEAGTASLSAPASGTAYAKDELVTLTVTVNAGYVVGGVKVGDEDIELDDGKYSFKVKGDTEVTVFIRAIAYYKVTVEGMGEDEGSATLLPDPNSDGKYREGSEVTLTVAVNYGYELVSVKVDGTEVTLDEKNSCSFKVEKDMTVGIEVRELKSYNLSVTFDAALCNVTCRIQNEDGQMADTPVGQIKSVYEGERSFAVVPVAGYKVKSVTVNGTPVTVDAYNRFTVDVQEDLNIKVECEWDCTSIDALAGDYPIRSEAWYSFKLTEPAVFAFRADNYAAQAAFFLTEQIEQPATSVKPDWVFNPDMKIDCDFHSFAAGSYLMRLSPDSDSTVGKGDDEPKSTLSIVSRTAVTFDMQPVIGNEKWKSVDGTYLLYWGTRHFILTNAKTGEEVTTSVEQKEAQLTVTLGGTAYSLCPVTHTVGEETVNDPLFYLTTTAEGKEDLFFAPEPLPYTAVSTELMGSYLSGKSSLLVSGTTLTLDGVSLLLLSDLKVPEPEDTSEEGTTAVAFADGKVYLLTPVKAGGGYTLRVVAGLNLPTEQQKTSTYSVDDDAEVTIDEAYWGTWQCKTTASEFYNYTLTLSEHEAILKNASGETVNTVLGVYKSAARLYPQIKIGDSTYYMTILHGSLNLTTTSQPAKTVYFVKQTAAAATAAAETAPLPFGEEMLGQWKNAALGLVFDIRRNSITVSAQDGSAAEHTLSVREYRGEKHNAVTLGGTVYVFLKAEGT